MAPNTETRFLVTAKPAAWSPYKRGWSWDNNAQKWNKVWIKNYRRIFTDGRRISLTPHPGMRSLENWDEVKFVKEWAKKKGWDTIVQRKVIELFPHLTGDIDCKPELLKALNRAAAELGVKIHIASGARTLAEQTELYNRYKAGKGPLAAYPNPNAPHIRGIAADCWINGVNILNYSAQVRPVLKKHSLCLNVPGETWHVQHVNDTPGTKWAV